MPIENKFERVPEDHPNRCQGVVKSGQCPYRAEPPDTFCPRCRAHNKTVFEQRALKNYRLSKFRAEVEEKSNSSHVKSLREEIGIVRYILEELINRCEDSHDLILQSNKINELVARIEKLVTSCHRLEKSTGELLDKTALIQLAGILIDLISDYVDEEVQATISQRIINEVITMKIEVLE